MRGILGIVFVGSALGALGTRPEAPDAEVDFVRDVLPILSGTCYECHGPDEAAREADLRLDLPDELAKELGPDLFVVRPGDPGKSELYWRISTDFESDRMPPTWSGKPALTADEIATIRHWIEEGAEWRQHWAYVAPERPEPPAVERAEHPIDAFVRARLAKEGLAAAPEADRATLIRRVSLDLTGLPPTVEEVDAFLADESPDAYERLVDRLLASPHYGEKQARLWLDLARYADTHGYEKDQKRVMWPYRDWVIDAFNADMPFDRFTIEQLAGDLLPDATASQLVATGFHRNTMLNQEGGVDPEEFRAAAVVDRVNTTASVWLGTTMGCVQCHSHKYDPFTQEEYYRLYAFFDQTTDDGSNEEPVVAAPTPEEERRLEELASAIAALEDTLAGPLEDVDAEQLAWEAEVAGSLPEPTAWEVLRPTDWRAESGATLGLLNDGSLLALGTDPETDAYEVVARPGPGRIDALRVEALRHETLPTGGPGRAPNGNYVLTDVEVEVRRGEVVAGRRFAAAEASYAQLGGEFPAARAIDASADTGWAVDGHQDRDDLAAVFVLDEPLELEADDELVVVLRFDYHTPHVLGRLRLSIGSDERLFAAMTPPPMGVWHSIGPFQAPSGEEAFDTVWQPEADFVSGRPVAPVYDGRFTWHTRPDWEDGAVHPLAGESSAFYLMRTIQSPDARRLLLSLGSDDAIRVWLNGELVHSNEVVRGAAADQDSVVVDLPAGPSMLLVKIVNHAGPAGFYFDPRARTGEEMTPEVVLALRLDPGARDDGQRAAIRSYYRRHASPRGRELHARLDAVRAEHAAVDGSVARTMVMQEREERRETFVHVRGNFLSPGERVEPGVPVVLPPLPAPASNGSPGSDARTGPPDRLALARWLVDPMNPLTARVTVNRLWQQVFGVGLVPTSEDFGTRGDAPVHPELLDWLAVEFVEQGWSVKRLLRTIVTSATYRQASGVTAALAERDPANLLLARGPRFRVEAEAVRDLALAASGLLDRTVGGPAVFPPQPDGIWAVTYSGDEWTTSEGGDRWRRGLYTFLRRTAPYPTFAMFDATSRELSCTRRNRSNTPLQALALLNDPAFVEASKGLAVRMLTEAGPEPEERARRGFRLCLAREPTADELAILVDLYRAEREAFAADPDGERGARTLATLPPGLEASELDPLELAAWTVVAGVLLNLDETITKS